jgi:hypothetical protein
MAPEPSRALGARIVCAMLPGCTLFAPAARVVVVR